MRSITAVWEGVNAWGAAPPGWFKLMEKAGAKKLYIIDGSSILYRAFHAIKGLRSSRGLPTNAVYGFTQTLRKILKGFSPEYIVVAFDVKGATLRHGLFKEYKAERPPMPETLALQIPYVKKVLEAFNVRVLESESYEADDIIAAIARRLSGEGVKTAIVSGDKDMCQLVDDNTVILDYTSGKEMGPGEVEEKFGVKPPLVRDLLALAGDPSDNIPGLPGVGFKTAAKVVASCGSVDEIYGNLERVPERLRGALIEFKDRVMLSRDLATLHYDVPLKWDLEDFRYRGPDVKMLVALLKELEFGRIEKEVMEEASFEEESPVRWIAPAEEDLDEALAVISRAGLVSVGAFFSGDGATSELLGAAIAVSPEEAFYIHSREEAFLRRVLEDEAIRKTSDDSKPLHLWAIRNGFSVRGLDFDTSIASYLIDPSRADHGVSSLAYEYLGLLQKEVDFESLDGEGRAREASKKACKILGISEILHKKLKDSGLEDLYLKVELPLSGVLADMEFRGIKVDRKLLEGLSRELERDLQNIKASIYRAAGVEFNINSPKQLQDLLFTRLGLRPRKRTKTGYSTDEEVLTELSSEHDVPKLILDFRTLQKFKSTYVDAITEIINPATGRVHTSFNQTITATGRLSSSRPNLQNIPVRGELAGRIREAFVSERGFTLLCADYSQIELRIVAHMSGDPTLIEAFMRGEDIHARTACEVFGVSDPSLVTTEMRRRSKAINFGIIYGMGPWGLSSELGISVREAEDYIERYFEHYSKVREFIGKTIQEAAEKGYTTTLLGRRRYIPELRSPVEGERRLGERLAINTPVQGSAADIIKIAMLKVFNALREGNFRSRMILQIHDELILEVDESELQAVGEITRSGMEGALELLVPVKVNLKSGANWRAVEDVT